MQNKPTIKALEQAFDGDKGLVLFFLAWIKNGKNGVKAYQELHPHTDYATAGVLASRLLKKVRIEAILEVYGLGLEEYMEQLKDGLAATKLEDLSGEKVPDHATRRPYHDKLGKLLGLETDKPVVVQQNNTLVIPSELAQKYGLTKEETP